MIAKQAKKLTELNSEIRTLEQALSDASKGAEQINKLLAAYFGRDDLRIEVSADKRFQIFRGGVIAKPERRGEDGNCVRLFHHSRAGRAASVGRYQSCD